MEKKPRESSKNDKNLVRWIGVGSSALAWILCLLFLNLHPSRGVLCGIWIPGYCSALLGLLFSALELRLELRNAVGEGSVGWNIALLITVLSSLLAVCCFTLYFLLRYWL